jgi:hypothetical protein
MLCEICSNEITGLRVQWRRGFTAVCCFGCGMELGGIYARGDVDLSQPKETAIKAARAVVSSRSWAKATDRILEEKRPLWEALAKI